MDLEQDTKLSPMMSQWRACKNSVPGALLFFRLGDFYEAFDEDAVVIAKELDLTLTKRQETPMAGVPFHASELYIDKLVAKGFRVAIAEQMEDPRNVKGLVKREVVRVITPGTLISSTLLSDKKNNFLAAIARVGKVHGLAILDLTTADFRAMEFEETDALLDEVARLQPKEILLSQKWEKYYRNLLADVPSSPLFHFLSDWRFDPFTACNFLLRHFEVQHLDGFGLKGMTAGINAAGATLQYVAQELNLAIHHITHLSALQNSAYLSLNRATQKHLELIESSSDHGGARTLLDVIDYTLTPMGGREMKRWLTHPLLNCQEIRARQEGVEELAIQHLRREELLTHLRKIGDLERQVMRIETGYASPKDLVNFRFSLEVLPQICLILNACSSLLLRQAKENLPDLSSIVKEIQAALVDTPPSRLGEGETFRMGYHPEMDALVALKTDRHAWIAHYQQRLREETQVKTLKVGYTRAFGFYIEVSRGQVHLIPDSFQRRQTLTNAERFITPELKSYETQVLRAEEKFSSLELELFCALKKKICPFAPQVRQAARIIALIDCLLSLAQAAISHRWVKPTVDEGGLLEIHQGRHPIVEPSLGGHFVPNDVKLDENKERLHLITGPNMAGKSTFIRQVALIVILAQVGSFVPAQKAHIGIVDQVLSRIGANDDLSRGQSTFMVEMTETANILRSATNRSLVILDEIGRGTSTYDGIAIAWAVAEYLLTYPGKQAKTLFATHYWELTELEQQISGAVNFNVAVHESEGQVTFLRKIVRGGTDKSYGIHVAKLAGLPHWVIQRAQSTLKKLEKPSRKSVDPTHHQLSLFDIPT